MQDIYDYFNIRNRMNELQNNKIIIYNTDQESKKLCILLINLGYKVDGFLSESQKNDCKKYLNFNYYSLTELDKENEIISFITPFENKVHPGVNTVALFNASKRKCVIYGAGTAGEKTFDLLSRAGSEVVCFVDENIRKQNDGYCGRKVISPDEFFSLNDYSDVNFFISVTNDTEKKKIERRFSPQIVYIYSADLMDLMLYSRDFYAFSNTWNKVGGVYTFHYYSKMLSVGKKIIIISKYAAEAHAAIALYRLLGLNLSYGVSIEENSSYKDIGNVWDLLYEEEDDIRVFFVGNTIDEEEEIKKFIIQSGINKDCFGVSEGDHYSIFATRSLDPSVGFNLLNYPSLFSGKSNNSNSKKIVILGGSTTTVSWYTEKSIPEQLRDVLDEHSISSEIICTSIAGATCSHEIIKLVRDVLLQIKPDIVISYSLVNDLGRNFLSTHPFIHTYQFELFLSIVELKTPGISKEEAKEKLSLGKEFSDYAEYWLTIERCMNAICREFGIQFFCFLQPCYLTRQNPTDLEKNLPELFTDEFVDNSSKYLEIYNKCIEKSALYDWMYDYSGALDDFFDDAYFDSCHLYGKANRHIAEKIFEDISYSLYGGTE